MNTNTISRSLALAVALIVVCPTAYAADQYKKMIVRIKFQIDGDPRRIDDFLKDPIIANTKVCRKVSTNKEMPGRVIYVCDRVPAAFTEMGKALLTVTKDQGAAGEALVLQASEETVPDCSTVMCRTHQVAACQPWSTREGWMCYHDPNYEVPGEECP